MKRRRGGFSFTEILFAVMVLGIGFIMIAAIFPVAIKQTQATSEETNAATIAKGGVDYFEKIATNAVMPTTTSNPGPGMVVAADSSTGGGNTSFWSALEGNMILPSDPRYAWVPMYKRDIDATTGVASPYAGDHHRRAGAKPLDLQRGSRSNLCFDGDTADAPGTATDG